MPQDAFTLRYLCEELNLIFKGGKVNRITEPSNDELFLTIYTGKGTKKLLLNVNPSAPRIGIVEVEKESPLTAPNFCMLMRKHLLSAVVDGIELVGFDRIIKIDFTLSKEFFDGIKKTLFVELMGRYSNIILTENGKVLGGNRGINMFDDGIRPLIVGKNYVFPPVGNKMTPDNQRLISIFDNASLDDLGRLITDNVQGVATSTAKEIVTKYFKDEKQEIVNGKQFFNYLNNYLFNCNKKPCVLIEDNKIVDVFVYPYSFINGEIKYFDSLYQAEDFFFENREKQKIFLGKKERFNSLINTALKKAKKRMTAIKSKEKDALNAEENRIKGELILSNLYNIKQGQKQCEVLNYYDQSTMVIELDEYLSPSKNAEKYYKKYNKQKRTLLALEPQIEMAENELNYFLSLLDEVELCENIEELMDIEQELKCIGLIREQKILRQKNEEQALYRIYDINGYRVKVGKNNVENDKLTFSAKQKDIWMHAKDFHSSHLIIETNGKEVDDQTIKISAEICAYYSKGRDGGKVEIVHVEKKNVKKPSHAKLGFVTYDNFKSIIVYANKHDELMIKK